jgi:hypothetical protein
MDAHDVRLTHLIDGQKQFIIPVGDVPSFVEIGEAVAAIDDTTRL